MSFLKPNIPKPVEPVDPAQTENRLLNSRVRKLNAGGRNATFMAQAAEVAQRKPTLTGLGG